MTHQIDVTKGQLVSTVSEQWAQRPDDQRFLSLSDMRGQVARWAEESTAQVFKPGQLTMHGVGKTGMVLEADGKAMEVSHYAFDQLAEIARVPANYARRIDPALAALNLNYGLRANEQKEQAIYFRQPAPPAYDPDVGAPMPFQATLLRGITGPRYGRIYDRDVVDAVMKIAGNGTGDTHWKVPGTIDWTSSHGVSYNPQVDITKQNTTLYASDRDIFLFLVDDMNPIEVGKLASGAPDLMFRGFYVWNSEVGDKTFGVATMYLRGVCQNRNLWGVEGFNEVTFRHTAGAPERFASDAAPALETFAQSATSKLIDGVAKAKGAVVSTTDEDRLEFLAKLGFSLKQAKELIATAVAEEGQPPVSVWDHAQAITARARYEPFQESRLAMERIAGELLDKVKV